MRLQAQARVAALPTGHPLLVDRAAFLRGKELGNAHVRPLRLSPYPGALQGELPLLVGRTETMGKRVRLLEFAKAGAGSGNGHWVHTPATLDISMPPDRTAFPPDTLVLLRAGPTVDNVAPVGPDASAELIAVIVGEAGLLDGCDSVPGYACEIQDSILDPFGRSAHVVGWEHGVDWAWGRRCRTML